MRINIEDAARKSAKMEQEALNIIERWHGKIAVVRKAIEDD